MTPHAMTRAFRERALAGERLLGTVVACHDLALAEIAAARLDFLWIDLEHSPLAIRDVQDLCIAARAAGCPTIVRVGHPASDLVTVLLDVGVNGVIAPRVEDPTVAAAFAASLRYPPHGTRGFAPRRATGYGLDHAGSSTADDAPLCLIQIESARAVERAEEIGRVEGVDALIVGPNDLALDLGVDQDLTTPELLAAIDAVHVAAARAGVVHGVAAGGPPDVVARTLGDTATLLAYSADVRIYAQAIDAAAASMAERWSAVAPAR